MLKFSDSMEGADMANRMNRRGTSTDTNPYAAPEIADRSMPVMELPPGSPWKIDGDALLCRGDLTFDWLCFATGLPVGPDAKYLSMKLFVPSQQRRILFRLFHSSSIATIVMMLLMGSTTQLGAVKISGVPSFVFLWAFVGIFIFVLRRTPSFRINYCLSPEGRRRRMFRRTIPCLAAGLFVAGPTAIVLPQIFAASMSRGLIATCISIMAIAGFMMLLPEPRAVSSSDGVYRVTYLSPELLAALRI